MKKFLCAFLMLLANCLLFAEQPKIPLAGWEKLTKLLSDYSAIEIEADAELVMLGDGMSECSKTTHSKLTAISAIADISCVIDWDPEEMLLYGAKSANGMNPKAVGLFSRRTRNIYNVKEVKTYYFGEADKIKNASENSVLIIRALHNKGEEFIPTFYTGKMFLPNFVEFYPDFKGGYYSVIDILQTTPKTFNKPIITRNGDIVQIYLETGTNLVKCEINITNMEIRYIENIYKDKKSGTPTSLVRYDYKNSITIANQNVTLPQTVVRTLYSYEEKSGNKYTLSLNSFELLHSYDISKYEVTLTKGWRVDDMIKKIRYTIGESNQEVIKEPVSTNKQ